MDDDTAQERTWSTAQLGAFIDEVRDDRLLALWLLIATTGLRLSTLTNLRRDEVDLHERRLSSRPRPMAVGQAEGATSPRDYALDPDAYDALKDHVVDWDKTYGAIETPSGKLFRDGDGNDLSPADVTSRFRRHCAQANLPAVPFREVRQAYIIAALETGIPTKVLRERLGDLESPSLGVGEEPTRRASRRHRAVAPEGPDRGKRPEQSTRHLRSVR